jgi:predicted amino acid-binding ACT domain protein
MAAVASPWFVPSDRSAGDPLMFEYLTNAGIAAWQPEEFYVFALANGATNFVDISNVLEEKLTAFMFHISQVQNQTAAVAQQLKWVGQQIGNSVGVPYAEAYTAFF